MCHKGFTKWENQDSSTSQYLSNSLSEIFPGDLTTLIMSYVKNIRSQITKDRNETLALSMEEKACISGFSKFKRWDTLSILCSTLFTTFVTLERKTHYDCFVYRLLKHFFLTYSFQEQLLVAVGLFFTASWSSSDIGKSPSSQNKKFHCWNM